MVALTFSGIDLNFSMCSWPWPFVVVWVSCFHVSTIFFLVFLPVSTLLLLLSQVFLVLSCEQVAFLFHSVPQSGHLAVVLCLPQVVVGSLLFCRVFFSEFYFKDLFLKKKCCYTLTYVAYLSTSHV